MLDFKIHFIIMFGILSVESQWENVYTRDDPLYPLVTFFCAIPGIFKLWMYQTLNRTSLKDYLKVPHNSKLTLSLRLGQFFLVFERYFVW